jgi:hypothetical protein
MRKALLTSILCVAVAGPGAAFAAGPVVGAGVTTTIGDNSSYNNMTGSSFKIGFEIGSHHLRHEWAFNETSLTQRGGYDGQLKLTGASYQVEWLFREHGFSPYLGLGLEMGIGTLDQPRLTDQTRYSDSGFTFLSNGVNNGPYLRPYAVGGIRYTFGIGLGIRAEATASTCGKFESFSGNLALSYTW